jgi:hypothetical protein
MYRWRMQGLCTPHIDRDESSLGLIANACVIEKERHTLIEVPFRYHSDIVVQSLRGITPEGARLRLGTL